MQLFKNDCHESFRGRLILRKTLCYKEFLAITYLSTILRQIVAFLLKHEFESFTNQQHVDHNLRSFNRWSQLRTIGIDQFS